MGGAFSFQWEIKGEVERLLCESHKRRRKVGIESSLSGDKSASRIRERNGRE